MYSVTDYTDQWIPKIRSRKGCKTRKGTEKSGAARVTSVMEKVSPSTRLSFENTASNLRSKAITPSLNDRLSRFSNEGRLSRQEGDCSDFLDPCIGSLTKYTSSVYSKQESKFTAQDIVHLHNKHTGEHLPEIKSR